MPFVEGFVESNGGAIPRVATALSLRDHLGAMGVRTGFARNNYRVTPGLYCTGEPTKNSPVLVTANYKLSFDGLRKELNQIPAWILVVDTRGINVWCASGKGTFSAEEVAYQVQRAGLEKIVDHRKLILPQLCANGVALHILKELCGFRGQFGPIKASALVDFIESGTASETMRAVTFSFPERAILIPLEICMLWKQLAGACVIFFLISGISSEIYSLSLSLQRTVPLMLATLLAIFSGAVLTPLLLPWIPFRQFWLKGSLLGLITGLFYLIFIQQGLSGAEKTGALLWMISCSSYLAMNFTGSTVFTSLSGVKEEMNKGLLLQTIAAALALILWIAAPFLH